MIRYRIQRTIRHIQMDMLCDGMEKAAAMETLQMLQSLHPENEYVLEEYNFDPGGPRRPRLGRDPDLH